MQTRMQGRTSTSVSGGDCLDSQWRVSTVPTTRPVTLERITEGTTLIDLEHLGTTHVIGSYFIQGDNEAALVDPGPTSDLPTLEARLAQLGAAVDDLTALLLTHIHLDHAGATGTLVRRNPKIQVYVHEKGARHMIDPERLLRSAVRLYGDQMDRLWGEFLPVPEANVRVLSGDEVLRVAGHDLEVAYTPGHASHHVGYLERGAGCAFVGDTAGIRLPGCGYVMAPTPPPDIHLEGWNESLDAISSWDPQRLLLTHFGPVDGVGEHISQLRELLATWSASVHDALEAGASDATAAAAFARDVAADLRRSLSEEEARRYEKGGTPELSWYGLARYWRKKEEHAA